MPGFRVVKFAWMFQKTLLQSINKIIELYYLQISFFLEAIEFYRMRSEDAKNKFYPTEEELNPNLKLLQNSLILSLQQNKEPAETI